MKQKKLVLKKIIFMIAILAIGIVSITSCARIRFFKASFDERVEILGNRIAKELELDNSQKEVLDKVLVNVSTKFKENREKSQEKRTLLNEHILSDELDVDSILNSFEEKQPEKHDNVKYILEQIADFHAVLTYDQKLKLVQKLDEMHNRFYKMLHID